MIANAKWCDYAVAREYGLRPRHVDLLAGAAKGMSNVEIGAAVCLTTEGVRSGWAKVFSTLKVHERAAAVAKAYDLGVFRPLAERVALADPSLTREQQLTTVRRRLAELQALLDSTQGEHLRAVS